MADRARNARPRIKRRAAGWLAAAGLLLLGGTPAFADHSLGNACTTCHSLRSTSVVAGTRNINSSLISKIFPYGPDNASSPLRENAWYCPGSVTDPRFKLDGVFVGGDPLDCSYCHKAGTDDIGSEIGNASDVVGGGGVAGKTASAHPVDTRATANKSWGGRRIACNQCHSDEVSPTNLCTKGTGTGYPNHTGTLTGNPDTLGLNQRTGVAAHLRTPYDATAGSNWTTTTGVLCFDCHKSGGLSDVDVKSDYDKVGGGHNISGIGSLGAKKLPCYDCHDPHGVATNAKLIIERKAKIVDYAKQNPFGTSYSSAELPPTGFDGTNDRVVCAGCHNSLPSGPATTGYTVEGIVLPKVLAATWVPSAFPFHADAHKNTDGTAWAGNCLQKNGGCHQGPHNTDIFRCLDCHSRVVTDAMTAAGVTVPPRLLAVNHIDSEFGHIGDIGTIVNSSTANYIQSAHSIPYKAKVFTIAKTPAAYADPSPTLNMSTAADNGCLYCHDTIGLGANVMVAGPSGAGATTGSRGKSYAGDRRGLQDFDPFCLSCHDGAGDDFVQAASYSLSNGNTGTLTYTARTMKPPQVNNETAMGNGYHYSAGHGRGLTGSPSGDYPSGLTSPTTENRPANIPCLECHLYHGSTAYKLLPGWRETDDGTATASKGGHVVKGGHAGNRSGGYLLKPSGKASTGVQNSIGGFLYSTAIDYTDHYVPVSFTWGLSDYKDTTAWSSYGHTRTPDGVPTPFGTAGDVFQEACGVIGDTEKASYNAAGSKEIGFCNVCHQFNNGTFGSVGTNGATSTYDVAYTHQGTTEVDCNSKTHKSDRTFWRDCLECHDPHGSGTDTTGTAGANIFMIRQRMKYPTNDAMTTFDWTNVLFTSRLGARSFDENDATNLDDLCNVCHRTLGHSNQTGGGSNAHYMGERCTDCHTHAAEAP